MKKINKKILFAPWAGNNKNYFSYQTWYSPLKSLFKEIVTFDPQESAYNYGVEEMNKEFLKVVEKEKPDYIFLWLIYNEFDIDTLAKIKEVSPNTITVNFFGDDDVLFDTYSRYYSLFIDYPLASHFLYFDNYKKEGVKNVFFSCGVNTENFKFVKSKKNYDVTFIGTPMGDRAEYLKYLIDNGINVKIFGRGWDKHPELKKNYGGALSPEDATKIMNESKINLSFTKNYRGVPGFKARVFEIAACKTFLLSEYFEGYKEFLKENNEIIMFKDKDSLLNNINYYLKNEKKREEIAEKAYKKVINSYSQKKEFERIFKSIEKIEKKKEVKTIPKMNKNVAVIDLSDISGDIDNLNEKIGDSEYVSFLNTGDEELSYRRYIQVYALEKTGKNISCCDYYLSNKIIGDYLAFQTYYAYKTLDSTDFFRLFSISQMVVRKSYLMKNINLFKEFKANNEKLINEDNVAFIRSPLVRIGKRVGIINYDMMDKVFLPIFENNLRVLKNKNSLFTDRYSYKLLLTSLFNDNYLLHLIKSKYKKGFS